jgi:hypothetical protein
MRMRLVTSRVLTTTTAMFLMTVAVYSLGYSQGQSGNQGSGRPLTIDEFKSQMDIPDIRANVDSYLREIGRRGIAFLPTEKLKKAHKNTVSDKILNELGNHVVFYLQISEFDCRNCANKTDGKAFAEFLLDRVRLLTGSKQVQGGSNPLFGSSIAANLAPINGREQIDTAHVYLVVTGNVTKKGNKERVEVWLSYIDAGYTQPTLLQTTAWEYKPAARSKISADVADWVVISLRPVITRN